MQELPFGAQVLLETCQPLGIIREDIRQNFDGHLATQARIASAWDRLEAHLGAYGPWIAGSRPSAADYYAGMLARWSRNMPRPATHWPAIAELVARLRARPSFRTLNEREGLTEWT